MADPDIADVVTVTGTGVAVGRPTYVELMFGVTQLKSTPREADHAVTAAARKAIAALVALGVPERGIHTSVAEIAARHRVQYDDASPIVGYQCSRRYTLRLEGEQQMGLASDALAAALEAGVNTVGGLTWGLAPEAAAALKLQALSRAREAARAKAEQLARELGHALGRLVQVEEGYEHYTRPQHRVRAAARASYERASAMAKAPGGDDETDALPAGTAMERAAVTLTFLLGADLGAAAAAAAAPIPTGTIASSTRFPVPTPADDPLYTWRTDSVTSRPPLP